MRSAPFGPGRDSPNSTSNAARADRHFSVVKTTTAEAAVSSIRVLSKKEHIAELGRMLGGGAAAETHAKTLLED